MASNTTTVLCIPTYILSNHVSRATVIHALVAWTHSCLYSSMFSSHHVCFSSHPATFNQASSNLAYSLNPCGLLCIHQTSTCHTANSCNGATCSCWIETQIPLWPSEAVEAASLCWPHSGCRERSGLLLQQYLPLEPWTWSILSNK